MTLFEKIRTGLDEQCKGKKVAIDPERQSDDISDNYNKNDTHDTSPVMSPNHAL
jgi:hypothetical protein